MGLIGAALITFALAGWLFVRSSASLPQGLPADRPAGRGAVGVIHERGVTVSIFVRAQSGVATPNRASLELLAAWPMEWERPPLIILRTGGVMIDVASDDGLWRVGGVAPLLDWCDPSESVFPDGESCSIAGFGELLQLETRSDHSSDGEFHQVLLNGELPGENERGQELLVTTESGMAGLGRDPRVVLGLAAGADIAVGGMILPFVPSSVTRMDGFLARLTMPAIDTGGNYYDSLCGHIDCSYQRRILVEHLGPGGPRGASALNPDEIAPLLIDSQPVPRNDDQRSESWLSHATGYVSAELAGDWTPYGVLPPVVTPSWPELIWDYDTIAPTEGTPSIALQSSAREARTRTEGFLAAVFVGLGVSLLLLALEQFWAMYHRGTSPQGVVWPATGTGGPLTKLLGLALVVGAVVIGKSSRDK